MEKLYVVYIKCEKPETVLSVLYLRDYMILFH